MVEVIQYKVTVTGCGKGYLVPGTECVNNNATNNAKKALHLRLQCRLKILGKAIIYFCSNTCAQADILQYLKKITATYTFMQLPLQFWLPVGNYISERREGQTLTGMQLCNSKAQYVWTIITVLKSGYTTFKQKYNCQDVVPLFPSTIKVLTGSWWLKSVL